MSPGRRGPSIVIESPPMRALLLLLAFASVARAETVRFEAADSLTLVGTLASPARSARGAIVLLHGSEPGRRDNPYFAYLRQRLVAKGWAVLSYDRRGVGESGGQYSETPDLAVPAADAAAAARFLAARGFARVGLLGISQGGWVAPLAATREPRVAFVIAISEPAVPPYAQSGFQRASEWVERGLTRKDADEARNLRSLVFRYWHGDVSRAEIDSAWTIGRARPWFARVREGNELLARIAAFERVPPVKALPAEIQEAVRSNFFYDPLPAARELRVPILHLYGAADRHLDVNESRAAFLAAYGDRATAAIAVVEHAGHGMQRVDGEAECFDCPAQGWVPAKGWGEKIEDWLDRTHFR